MPEIDGLRFIGVVEVILFIHMGTYIHDSVLQTQYDPGNYIYRFFYEGGYGIGLFFMVSGFILALPFAEQKLSGKKPLSLAKYFSRRLTRIEPAYIVSLIIYFILRVWVMRYNSFESLLPHFLASLFYVHNLVYDAHSSVNAVAWTLEVEVQFYLLAPFFSYIYFIKSILFRRIIFAVVILAGTVYSYSQQYEVGNILNKGCYFICGMLLAELYLLRSRDFNEKKYALLGAACFIASLFVPGYYVSVYYSVLKIILTLIFFFFVITNATLKKWLSYKPVAIIGGMCYSIYLVHMGILGLMRHRFATIIFSKLAWLNAGIHYIIAGLLILIVSGIFFLLIEKPTMKRDWYRIKY